MTSGSTVNHMMARDAGARLRQFLIPRVRPADLARAAGVSPQYIHEILNGKRPPSARIVQACRELGLPVELIFGSEAER